jgi:hypothetical protein
MPSTIEFRCRLTAVDSHSARLSPYLLDFRYPQLKRSDSSSGATLYLAQYQGATAHHNCARRSKLPRPGCFPLGNFVSMQSA